MSKPMTKAQLVTAAEAAPPDAQAVLRWWPHHQSSGNDKLQDGMGSKSHSPKERLIAAETQSSWKRRASWSG